MSGKGEGRDHLTAKSSCGSGIFGRNKTKPKGKNDISPPSLLIIFFKKCVAMSYRKYVVIS